MISRQHIYTLYNTFIYFESKPDFVSVPDLPSSATCSVLNRCVVLSPEGSGSPETHIDENWNLSAQMSHQNTDKVVANWWLCLLLTCDIVEWPPQHSAGNSPRFPENVNESKKNTEKDEGSERLKGRIENSFKQFVLKFNEVALGL